MVFASSANRHFSRDAQAIAWSLSLLRPLDVLLRPTSISPCVLLRGQTQRRGPGADLLNLRPGFTVQTWCRKIITSDTRAFRKAFSDFEGA